MMSWWLHLLCCCHPCIWFFTQRLWTGFRIVGLGIFSKLSLTCFLPILLYAALYKYHLCRHLSFTSLLLFVSFSHARSFHISVRCTSHNFAFQFFLLLFFFLLLLSVIHSPNLHIYPRPLLRIPTWVDWARFHGGEVPFLHGENEERVSDKQYYFLLDIHRISAMRCWGLENVEMIDIVIR